MTFLNIFTYQKRCNCSQTVLCEPSRHLNSPQRNMYEPSKHVDRIKIIFSNLQVKAPNNIAIDAIKIEMRNLLKRNSTINFLKNFHQIRSTLQESC